MIDPGLAGKVVLVTGANNPYGIGAAVARAFAAQGGRVFLHGYRPSGQASQQAAGDPAGEPGEAFYTRLGNTSIEVVTEQVRALGVRAEGVEADLSDPEAPLALFDRVEDALGPVQVLINNAAYWEADTFLPGDEDLVNEIVEMWTDRPLTVDSGRFDRIFAVNTRAAVLMMAEFARRHIGRGATWGRILNVSTDGAYQFPSEITYGASKFALESYTRSAAIELGRYGVTVNVVSPGPIQTGWITPAMEAGIVSSIPLGRIGRPEDVADALVLLASEQARWVTGQVLHVGGGHRT